MRILAVSDLHGELACVGEALDRFAPDLLVSCGDWGDEVAEAELAALASRVPMLTTFGNHDPLEVLPRVRDRDGAPVLLAQGEVRDRDGLRVAALGGIWAKSRRKPFYVTDEDVAGYAAAIARAGPVDLLLTHGCPLGLADRTPSGRPGGQRCFLEANRTIAPRIHLCGHLHVPQERTLGDGRRVLNVGATPRGSVVVLEADAGAIVARLERLRGRGG